MKVVEGTRMFPEKVEFRPLLGQGEKVHIMSSGVRSFHFVKSSVNLEILGPYYTFQNSSEVFSCVTFAGFGCDSLWKTVILSRRAFQQHVDIIMF